MHQILDQEHKQLKDLLHTINTHISEGHSVSDVFKLFDDFIILANQHFKNEEKIMNNSQYPQVAAHKKEHDALMSQLKTIESQLKGGQTPFGKDFMIWQTKWIEEHLSGSDDKLIHFLKMKNN